MIFETIFLSLFIGKIKKGKIKNIGTLYIRGWQFILLSFIINIISLLIIIKTQSDISIFLDTYFFIIHIIIYLLLIIGLLFNYKEQGLFIVSIGTILNFLPLLLNNGKMPVSPNGLLKSKLYGELVLLGNNQILTHSLMNNDTKLKLLCDIIPLSKPYPFPKVISIGDILISIGVFILLYNYMTIENNN